MLTYGKNSYIFLVVYSSMNIAYLSKVKIAYFVKRKLWAQTCRRISLKVLTSKTGGICRPLNFLLFLYFKFEKDSVWLFLFEFTISVEKSNFPMYTKFIDRNILNPCMNLLRDARQRWLEDSEKGFIKKNESSFYDLSIMKKKRNLRKNLWIGLTNGFCFISSKIISFRSKKTHENALYKPCVFTEDKWYSMLPTFFVVSLLF